MGSLQTILLFSVKILFDYEEKMSLNRFKAQSVRDVKVSMKTVQILINICIAALKPRYRIILEICLC